MYRQCLKRVFKSRFLASEAGKYWKGSTRSFSSSAGTQKNDWRSSVKKLSVAASVGAAVAAFYGIERQRRAPISCKEAETSAKGSVNYDKVREAIVKIIEEDDNIAPTMLRLAWHSSGTYDKKTNTGGSDGATMRFPPEKDFAANAGLFRARDALEPVKKQFPEITYADLWTLAGVVAIEEMGGPKVAWRPGRRDAVSGQECPPDGRLPDADKGSLSGTVQHIRDIFYRMGFNDQETVALIGAHAVGHTHKQFSGYDGPWTRAPTTFSNELFRELLENKWTLRKWNGPDMFEDPTGEIIMLPTDMALNWDKEFRKYVEIYAADQDRFFEDFAKAFQKLEELGVKAFQEEAKKKRGWFS
jgi:cytochrome c peroxidase